jgi:lysophospholipase L1-like esterase
MRTARSALIGLVGVVLTLGLAACGGAPEPATTPAEPTPTAEALPAGPIAVLGDSMSLGVNACESVGPCPEVSWALGDNPAVSSVSAQLAEAEGTEREHIWGARDGGTVTNAAAAVDKVVAAESGIVLVLVGANDVCRPSVGDVTPPETFAATYTEMLTDLREGLPEARIVTLSIPDLLQLWDIGRVDARIAELWNESPSCRSILGNAQSDAPEDVERRDAMSAVIDEYNAAISSACAATTDCVYDAGALHEMQFTAEDISTLDRFHPSASGQQKIASVAWPLLSGDSST